MFLPVELCLHFLSALGIFLGRRLRLNSWDMLRNPGIVVHETIDAFDLQGTLVFVVVVFFVLLILFRILALLDECVLMAWRQRGNRPPGVDGLVRRLATRVAVVGGRMQDQHLLDGAREQILAELHRGADLVAGVAAQVHRVAEATRHGLEGARRADRRDVPTGRGRVAAGPR